MKEHTSTLRLSKEVKEFGERKGRRTDGLAGATVGLFVCCFRYIFVRAGCVCVSDVLQISAVFASVAACLGFTIYGLLWALPAHIIENSCTDAGAQLNVKPCIALQTK